MLIQRKSLFGGKRFALREAMVDGFILSTNDSPTSAIDVECLTMVKKTA